MRVLVIDEEIPWPANTGKRLRTLNLLTCLAREFQIDLLVHGKGTTPDAVDQMRERGIAVHVSDSGVPDKGGLMLPARIAASLLAGLPYSVYSHHHRAYASTLDALLRANHYDLVHCEWTPYAIYLRKIALPVCVAAHNVEFEIWRRMALSERRVLHRMLFRLQAVLMERFERRVFARCLHATAVSEGDAATIRNMGTGHVVVVPNGVDAGRYVPPASDSSTPRSLVFTGSMDWRANQDAIRWFIDAVHPLLGDYQMHVVGRTPPAWMRDPAIVPPQIVVTGTVAEVQPYIERACVYVVPLRVGGGSRLKILEALAMGRAVVSTTVGAEGLDVEDGTNILIGDTPESFASAIMSLWADPRRRAELGAAGRLLIERRYQWDQIAPLQGALWTGAVSLARGAVRPSPAVRNDQR